MSKEEFRCWESYIVQYNYDNPKDQIAYEVSWKDEIYSVTLLDLKVDREVQV
jgi:hypothetical protein